MIPFSTSADDLLARIGLDPRDPQIALDGAARFPFKVPPTFADRMTADPRDPLLRQVLPDLRERRSAAHERSDPVGDLEAERVPGLLQKYRGRALLITTGACPIHCRRKQ